MTLKRNDILWAALAIGLAPRLSVAAKQTAMALIDHYNQVTGRCDPSVHRLATLLGLNEKTIRRAINELTQEGMFHKFSHGGHHNTCCYQPIWTRFREIILDWKCRFKEGTAPETPSSKRTRMTDKLTESTNRINLLHRLR